ncbi:MAG: hypothetical protein LBD27_00565 [Tannerella sp.]|nr:hypothetical protein [Tannerella sp.]
MKKFVLLMAGCLACMVLHAQEPQSGGRRGEGGRRFSAEEVAKRTTEWMTQELKLTEAQIAPVDSINLLFAKAQQILFQSAQNDREKIRESMTALNKEKETALSAVLTKEQLELYRKKLTERMNNRRRNR